MRFTYDDDTYSNLHKDARGFRPRNDGWDKLTPIGKQLKWDSLCEELDQNLAEECAAEARAVSQFESKVTDLIDAGAAHRGIAIRWLIESLGLSSDELTFYRGEIVCIRMGLPLKMQAVFDPVCENIVNRERNN